jgi:hypothetical protein
LPAALDENGNLIKVWQTEKTKYEEKIEKGAENSVEVNSKDGSG